MYKRILVTGGSAVAGDGLKSVVAKGEYDGREFIFPTSKECNMLDFEATQKFVADWKPDAIVHFAAISGGIQLTIDHPASVMRDNIIMNFNVAEAARVNGVNKVLMTLSAAIYPLDTPLPMKEEDMHKGYPHETNYSYAFAKRLIDPMAKAYKKEYGMSIVGIIPGAIIGPKSNFDPKSSTAIPALIRRFFENRGNNDPLVVWGDGSPVRQFTSDEDIARIAMWCIDNYDDPQVLNVSTMEDLSIKEAAYVIAKALGVDSGRITFDTTKPAGTHSQGVDNSKFVSLSHFKYTPARETITRTAKYFAEHYPDPKKLRL
ncbi:MAG TPA: NAD-dependent epimerase/dehydratase family protein [Candidatus Paceibacterota bacterium]|nr:NAD-dependent epimerase/dehydratase family protein [Candidatus Paceibacterota bacterium]